MIVRRHISGEIPQYGERAGLEMVITMWYHRLCWGLCLASFGEGR